ncbi:MAG: hypothetical protein K940chlam2_01372 [Chlamydiae bacterium]|nr:hypothetical protein [Chlamydiota bacterium]
MSKKVLILKNLERDPHLDSKELAAQLSPPLSIINLETYEQGDIEDQICIVQQNLRYVSAEKPPSLPPFAEKLLVLVQDNLHALHRLEQILSSSKLQRSELSPELRAQHMSMAAMKDMLFAHVVGLCDDEVHEHLLKYRSSSPFTSHQECVEELRAHFPFDETRGWHIYKSWWYKRYERGTVCAIYDLAIEWEATELLADRDGWNLSQEDAYELLQKTCLEKYPSYPFNGPHAQRMICELHYYRNRHKQEQSRLSEKFEASNQD